MEQRLNGTVLRVSSLTRIWGDNHMVDKNNDARERDRETARSQLATLVIWGSLAVVFIFGLAVIGVSTFLALPGPTAEMQAAEFTKGVFASALAVVSAWVSAVLAFYFVNQTAESASRTTMAALKARTVRDTVQKVSVREVMRLPDEIIEVVADYSNGRVKTPISKVLEVFAQGVTRAPIFEVVGKKWVLRAVLHESTVYEFLWRNGIDKDAASDTELQVLLDDPVSRRRWDLTLAYVHKGATLSDAKLKMDADKRIQDVVITSDGSENGEFVGWLTNVDVMRKCIAGAFALDEELETFSRS